MKLSAPIHHSLRSRSARRESGFTLTELLISSTLFILLVGGIVSAHLLGLTMFHVTQTKLNATDDARRTIGRMANEIRTCKSTWIGNVKDGVFQAVLDGEKQEGSGILIYPTTSTNNYIIYFVNPADNTFRRTSSTRGNTVVLAESITNQVVFSAQTYQGKVPTNSQNNRVIHLNLEFYQPKRHLQMADYYKLETSITRRALE